MIALEDTGTVAIVDPEHGAEVLELIGPSGARPLGRPAFAPRVARGSEYDEDGWSDRYRGGWQLAAPNAGNACVVEGERHGFHGGASNIPWALSARERASASLSVEVHGLRFQRRLQLGEGSLRIETEVTAIDGPAPMIAVEHVVCGSSVLDPALRLEVPPGRAFELDEAIGPTTTPAMAPTFPEILLRDGSIENLSSWPIEQPRARLVVVADLPEGRAEARNAGTGEGLALRWDVATLPHLWIWHEARISGGRWRGQAELLGLEPSMAPHSLGLERAVAARQARIVSRDEPVRWWIEATPLAPG